MEVVGVWQSRFVTGTFQALDFLLIRHSMHDISNIRVYIY